MANILKRLGAFRNKAITHIIETDEGRQEFRFYPPRMRMLLSGRMRQIIEPITQAIGVLFTDKRNDVSRQQEVESDGKVTTFVQGLNPEVIELRERKRSEAIKDALAVILDDNTRYQIGELLADSLRDDFSENEAERAKEVRQFMDALDVPMLVDFLKGYFQALAPVLDKSGNSILSGLQDAVKREVERALGRTGDGEGGKILDMPETDSPSETSETSEPQS